MIQGADGRILSYYRDRDVASFTELCKHADYPTDLGAYYIARLVRMRYLVKLKRGTYQITIKGKQQVIDLTSNKRFPQSRRIRVSLLFVGMQSDKYVCIRRKLQPFPGKIEWPAGEVYAGETFPEAARRLLLDRTGLEWPVHMHGFFRRVDIYKGEVFDDKLFAVHTYNLSTRLKLPKDTAREELLQLNKSEITKVENASKSLLDILHYVNSKQQDFQEHIYELEKTDLLAPGS